jgi:predicted aldo/keto reductase-like oxidoreductase
MPCPYGVDIAAILRTYNRCFDDQLLPNPDGAHDEEYLRRRRILLNRYKNNVKPDGRAERCIGCNQCSPKCPQSLHIPTQLKRVEELVERVRQEWK